MVQMANIYSKGQLVRLKAWFIVTGTYTDPDIVVFSVRDPSGNIESYNYGSGTVSKETTGKFYKDLFADEVGQWWYEFLGTGTVLASDESYFIVERSIIF